MKETNELLPCPFCGSEAESFNPFGDLDGTWTVLCGKCASSVGFEQTEAEAIAAWNTRAPVEYEGWFYLPKPKRGFVQYGTPQFEKTENGYRAKQPIEVIESAIRTWGDELDEHVMKRICDVFGSELGSEVNERSIDKWLRDFQLSNGNFTKVDGKVIKKLWAAMHDDIPLGYEASMRLADWLRVATLDGVTCHWEYPQNSCGWNGIIECSNCGHQFDGSKISENDWKCCPICCAKVVDV